MCALKALKKLLGKFVCSRSSSQRFSTIHSANLTRTLLLLIVALVGPSLGFAASCSAASTQISGMITDTLGQPIPKPVIELHDQAGRVVAHTTTNDAGRFQLEAPKPGLFSLVALKQGFKPSTKIVAAASGTPVEVSISLEAETALTLPIKGTLVRLPNGLSSAGATQYTLTQQDIQELPQGENAPLSDALAQMPGVSYDRNGLIHVRGWAIGNVQYEVNGVMLPLNIYNNSGFVQVLNSFMVKDVSLIDGILPSQYGFENDGVVKLVTKDGCSNEGGNVTLYGGMRETAQPSFEMAGCHENSATTCRGCISTATLASVRPALAQLQSMTFRTSAKDLAILLTLSDRPRV